MSDKLLAVKDNGLSGLAIQRIEAADAKTMLDVPAVDDTLSVAGMAADAKAAGDAITDIKDTVDELYTEAITIGKNKFNYQTFETDKKINSDGTISDATNGTGVTALIAIPSGATHVVYSYINSRNVQSVPTFNGSYGFYFYNSDGTLNSTAVGQEMSVDVPATASGLRVWMIASYASVINVTMIEFGNTMTEFAPYTESVAAAGIVPDLEDDIQDISNKVYDETIITVGTGKDYTSLVDAVASISTASAIKPVTIKIYPGEYETVVAADIDADYRGLLIPDHVNIVGVGDRDAIIIKGTLPSLDYEQYANNISTFNIMMNTRVENVTITATNLRYCNHDDSSTIGNIPSKHIFKNVHFLQYAKTITTQGYVPAGHCVGIGAQTQKEIVFEDCIFENYNANYGILIHDNNSPDAVQGAKMYVTRCNFVDRYGQNGTQCICLSNNAGDGIYKKESFAIVTESNLYNGIRIASSSASITTNNWKLFACGNNNYKIRQTGGMESADLAGDITAFNNVIIT